MTDTGGHLPGQHVTHHVTGTPGRHVTSTPSAPKPLVDKQTSNSSQCSKSQGPHAWETMVLFAVNLSRLDVHVNMGNVMGNTM